MIIAGHYYTLISVGLVLCVLAVLGLLVYAQMREGVPWNFWDMIKDDTSKRASLDKTITLVLCTLAIWYVVAVSTDSTFDTAGRGGATLVQVLSVFLVLRAARGATQAWKDKAPALPAAPSQGDNIAQQVVLPDANADAAKALPSAVVTPNATNSRVHQ